MRIEAERLVISELSAQMACALHVQSLDENTRCYVPDEVFETQEDAEQAIDYLLQCRKTKTGPQVCAVTLKNGSLVGYVQAVPLKKEWEIGYHMGAAYTGRGYAKEAVQAFLPVIMKQLEIDSILGICLAENKASLSVLEYCGFIKQFEGTGNYQQEQKLVCQYVYQL